MQQHPEHSHSLDKRQCAMLLEMGVRVWQRPAPVAVLPESLAALPLSPGLRVAAAVQAPVHVAVAVDSTAANVRAAGRKAGFVPPSATAQPPVSQSPPPADVHSDSSAVRWHMGDALTLYTSATPGPRWLVLAETPATAMPPEHPGADGPFNPFDGDAGKLLDNMLRAVRLHKTGSAMLAPLVRRVGTDAAPDAGVPEALATLEALLKTLQPDVVLVMGRLAAQALLQSSEPFGKLRGQVHTLHSTRTIVMHDAAYLLRSPLEKARAWEDLCLAVSVL